MVTTSSTSKPDHLHRNDNMVCPATLPAATTNSEWHVTNTSDMRNLGISVYFHGADRYDVRSTPSNTQYPLGTQCIYTRSGELVVGPQGGTFDFAPPYGGGSIAAHFFRDVLPEYLRPSIPASAPQAPDTEQAVAETDAS